jgi:hypothetical protein
MTYEVHVRRIVGADGVRLDGPNFKPAMTYSQARRSVEREFGPDRVVWTGLFAAEALDTNDMVELVTLEARHG